jgi:hypothetical protein
MAMKRSLARAERFAFGTESLVDDEELEEAARTVIEERNDPERVQRNSERYAEIYGVTDETEDEAKRRMDWEAEEIKRQRAQEGLL